MKSKVSSLTTALHTHGTHIAAITETHLTNNETINIKGYQWIGRNREEKGGGVGFLIRNDIKTLIEESNTPPNNFLESKWITVKGNANIAMGVIYGKQESATKDEAERQFQELTTAINRMQKHSSVIILGDLNAKLEITKNQCTQKVSRNGTLLQECIKQTNTTVINSKKNHQGTWTRVNRKNSEEKSIINYVITSKLIKVIESATDTDNTYRIEGINQTDHNVITATINTELEKATKKNERWKKGKPEDWVKFNQEIHEKWRNTHTDKRNYTTLQNLITRSLKTTIGSTVISTNKREKITNPQIKEAKEKRREYKRQFEQACKERKDCKAEL